MSKPRLLFFFNGLPEYEALFHIALGLKKRDRVEPVCFAPWEPLRREPRLRPMIKQSGLKVTIRPNRWLKLFPKRWLNQGDCVITMADPTLDQSPSRPRSEAMLDLKMPTVFVQHGVVQTNLNVSPDQDNIDYSSSLLLTFEALISPKILSKETQDKIAIVGFVKPVLFRPRPALQALPKHKRAILFCHSFRWAGRYGEDDVNRFYNLVSAFAKSNPNDLMIIRSHRGKSRALYRQQEKELADTPNIVFSHAYKGPLKGLSMTDVLGLSDLCISTVSTAVLDSIYMDKPTAIYENDQAVFHDLPNITGLESLEAFVNNPDSSNIKEVKKHYGDVEANIEKCCDAIETLLLAKE